MTYLMLGNKSKDGLDLSDLFRRPNGRFKSLTELKKDIPFQQMARLVQVYTIAYSLRKSHNSLTKKLHIQTYRYQMCPILITTTSRLDSLDTMLIYITNGTSQSVCKCKQAVFPCHL